MSVVIDHEIGGKPLAADALLGRFLPRLGPLVATPAASLVSCWLIRRRFVSCFVLAGVVRSGLPGRALSKSMADYSDMHKK